MAHAGKDLSRNGVAAHVGGQERPGHSLLPALTHIACAVKAHCRREPALGGGLGVSSLVRRRTALY